MIFISPKTREGHSDFLLITVCITIFTYLYFKINIMQMARIIVCCFISITILACAKEKVSKSISQDKYLIVLKNGSTPSDIKFPEYVKLKNFKATSKSQNQWMIILSYSSPEVPTELESRLIEQEIVINVEPIKSNGSNITNSKNSKKGSVKIKN